MAVHEAPLAGSVRGAARRPPARAGHRSVIIDRYITVEIVRPFGMVTGALAAVFAGYSSAARLADAAQGLIQISSAAKLIMLNTLVALEILLPTALYFSVLSALGRLPGDSEMIGLNAAGVSEARITRPVLGFAIVVAMVTGLLSLYARPWAYRECYRLEADAVSGLSIDNMEAGRFLSVRGGRHALYAERIDRGRQRLESVFLQTDRGDSVRVIRAHEASLKRSADGDGQTLEFHDGYSFLLDRRGSRDVMLRFKVLAVALQNGVDETAYRRKAVPSASLAQSASPRDVAEYQWRLSTPLATLLLALLAVPLSRDGPRRGRFHAYFIAVLVYTALFNLIIFARNLVEQGIVGSLPGLWWAYGLPAGLLAVLMRNPRLLDGTALP